jgi:death-on-curing protein
LAEGNGGSVAWLDDLVESIRRIHDGILDASGGARGDHHDKLYGAVARPFQMAFGEFLFPSSYEKAAALFHGIITGHAFVDGNKRTACVVAAVMLREIEPSIGEPSSLQMRLLGDIAVETASGELDVQDVAFWLARIFAPP